MRTLNIKMTAAAKDRLKLLKDLDALPLPLDKEQLRPFDFGFVNNVMCVTVGNHKVAMVPNYHNGEDFSLSVVLAPDARADHALKRFFSQLTEHLDQVARVINHEKRADTLTRRQRAAIEKAQEKAWMQERMAALDALWVKPEMIVQDTVITLEDLAAASLFQASHDVFSVTIGHAEIPHIRPAGTSYITLMAMGMSIEVRFEDGDAVFHPSEHLLVDHRRIYDAFTAEGRVLDEGAMRREIIRMRDRNASIRQHMKARAFIDALPEGEYKIETFAIDKPEIHTPFQQTFEGVDVYVDISGITLSEQGCPVYTFRPCHVRDGRFPTVPGDAVQQDRRRGDEYLFPSSRMAAVGHFMISCLAEANPDIDFSRFREISVETLLAEVDNTDIGYGL